jgi:RimJ/RimL family protein N-acetyltransferase
MLKPAPLESARFGLRTFRATLTDFDAEALFRELVEHNADLAILRLPPRNSAMLLELERHGLRPLHADTLVTYECRLQESEPNPVRNPSIIGPARPEDEKAIVELVSTIFRDYPNHYRANPLLDPADVVAGYCEWALAHLHAENLIAWLARVNGRVAAIACSSFDRDRHVCHGVLHGVHPDFSGSGIYTDLIRYTQHYFRHRGYKLLKISTQVCNLPVQRVWGKEGFVLTEVLDTFHINALLDQQRDCVRMSMKLADPGQRGSSLAEAAACFLGTAIATRGNFSHSTGMDCDVAIHAPLKPDHEYAVHVREYLRTHVPNRAICSATLHDLSGAICGIAQFAAAVAAKAGER